MTASEAADLNPLVHQPGRLAILAVLAEVEEADFVFLLEHTGLTKGNLSSHSARLEDAGYVDIDKSFAGKVTRTVYRLTEAGASALDEYRSRMTRILARLADDDE